MRDIVKRMKKYVDTYDQQSGYLNYTDRTFIEDMLYGIGTAMEPEEHRFAAGHQKFISKLVRHIEDVHASRVVLMHETELDD